jgi:hypothetical protein
MVVHRKKRPVSPAKESFSQLADESSSNLLSEFWCFLKYNKKWWLTPIILTLLLVGLLIILGGSAAAPFIYTLF